MVVLWKVFKSIYWHIYEWNDMMSEICFKVIWERGEKTRVKIKQEELQVIIAEVQWLIRENVPVLSTYYYSVWSTSVYAWNFPL